LSESCGRGGVKTSARRGLSGESRSRALFGRDGQGAPGTIGTAALKKMTHRAGKNVLLPTDRSRNYTGFVAG
ncbi:hypothetical protein, partial [Arthrobacter sp. H14]|uniref:hypothetical protein n=1 Tax=Arthrobacter sp. H14 TaxID=1312959 RepID=UPI001C1E6510